MLGVLVPLAEICLAIQMISGIFLAMHYHYTLNINLTFK